MTTATVTTPATASVGSGRGAPHIADITPSTMSIGMMTATSASPAMKPDASGSIHGGC